MTPNKRCSNPSYSEGDILNALAELRNKTLTIRKAAKKYKVPYSTLGNRASGKFAPMIERPGNNFLLDKMRVILI